MATRKKPLSSPPTPPPTDGDGFLCLSGDALWKWRALDAEFRAANVEMDSVKRQIAAEIAKYPELTALMGKQLELFGTIGTARAELAGVQADVEKLFGVSLKECAFDDKTGRLYHLMDDGERGEPMRQKKAKRRKR